MVRVVQLLFALVVVVLLAGIGARRMWHNRIDRLVDAVNGSPVVDPVALQGAPLPLPVARYFAAAIPAGAARVRAVELDTAGDFLMSGGSWKPFRARQRFNAVTPGFVWDARITMAPLMPVFVRDAYADGRGEMVARVLAAYAVVNESGSKELAEGQLMRYLAEMMWFPTALTPGHGVTWTAIDDHRAMAHLEDLPYRVSLRFTFNDQNEITEVFAPARMRAVKNGYEATPWAVRCWDYQTRLGLRIPIACEAEWRLPAGPLPYWRGRVTNVRYEN